MVVGEIDQPLALVEVRRRRRGDQQVDPGPGQGDPGLGAAIGFEQPGEHLAERRDQRRQGGLEQRTFDDIDDAMAGPRLKADNRVMAAA